MWGLLNPLKWGSGIAKLFGKASSATAKAAARSAGLKGAALTAAGKAAETKTTTTVAAWLAAFGAAAVTAFAGFWAYIGMSGVLDAKQGAADTLADIGDWTGQKADDAAAGIGLLLLAAGFTAIALTAFVVIKKRR